MRERIEHLRKRNQEDFFRVLLNRDLTSKESETLELVLTLFGLAIYWLS